MYEKIVLPNGVRILTEQVPSVRSAAVGIWVEAGSRHEGETERGMSHFIEHMVFKGTARRSAQDCAVLMDRLGGQVNAFTTKECTCFYAKTLDEELPLAIDLLADLYFGARFDEADVNVERGVILEEIGMYEDTPEDLVTERLFSAAFRGHSLGRPILGTEASLRGVTGRRLRAYRKRHYTPERTLVALAGRFTADDLAHIKDCFSGMTGTYLGQSAPAAYHPAVTACRKDIEQNHLCIAFPGVTLGSRDRCVLQLLSNIVGGNMSSRLFQEVREKRGLCYNIYSFCAAHEDVGLFCIYVALSREMESRALGVLTENVRRVALEGVTEEELALAKEQTRASIYLGLESTVSRMNQMAKGELYRGEVLSGDELAALFEQVTLERVQRMAQSVFDFDRVSLSAVGRVRTAGQYRRLLED
ncbi:MAG TPA: pitrilysin family protein [Oscillospiraceae bacterium]|nr:pitrilysin family protein [Oscillospiraceae bacterium]